MNPPLTMSEEHSKASENSASCLLTFKNDSDFLKTRLHSVDCSWLLPMSSPLILLFGIRNSEPTLRVGSEKGRNLMGQIMRYVRQSP